MRNPFMRGVGGVLSADIAVPDHERELGFYTSILTTGDAPLWRSDLMSNHGMPVIGLGERTAEYDSLPLQWMPHFQVADVAASAQRAIEMGGQELMHGKTDDGRSQWAVLSDRFGAAFGIIPVVTDDAYASSVDEAVGRISWLSLSVQDAYESQSFYQHVVGWNPKPIGAEGRESRAAEFEMQLDSGISAAVISEHRDHIGAVPSAWLIHLPVDDFAESLRRVGEGGGEVIQTFAQGAYAIIRDPLGVHLALQNAH